MQGLPDIYKVTNRHSAEIEELKKKPLLDFSQDIIDINIRIDNMEVAGMTGEEINKALASGPLQKGINTDLLKINVDNLTQDSPAQLANMQEITQFFDQTDASTNKVLIKDLQQLKQEKQYYYDGDDISETIPQSEDYEVLTKISDVQFQVLKVFKNNTDLHQLWNDIIIFDKDTAGYLTFGQRQIRDNTFENYDPRYWEPVLLKIDNSGIITVDYTGFISGFKVTQSHLHDHDMFFGFKNSHVNCEENSLLTDIIRSNIQSQTAVNIVRVTNIVGIFNGIVNMSNQGPIKSIINQSMGTLTIFGMTFGEIDINQNQGTIFLKNNYSNACCKIYQQKGQITLRESIYKTIDIQSINSEINIGGLSSTDGIVNIIAHNNTISFTDIYICNIINSDFYCSANLLQSVNIKESKVDLSNDMSTFDKVNFNICNSKNVRLDISGLPQDKSTLINIIDYTGGLLDTTIEPFTTTNPINVLIQGPFLSFIKLVDPETQTLQYTAVNGGYTAPVPPPVPLSYYYQNPNYPTTTIPTTGTYETLVFIADNEFYNATWNDTIYFNNNAFYKRVNHTNDISVLKSDFRYWEQVVLLQNQETGVIDVTDKPVDVEVEYPKHGTTYPRAGFKTAIGPLHLTNLFEKWHHVDIIIYDYWCLFSDKLINIKTIPVSANVQDDDGVKEILVTSFARLIHCQNITIHSGTQVHIGERVGLGGNIYLKQITGNNCRIFMCNGSCTNATVNLQQEGGVYTNGQIQKAHSNIIMFKQMSCLNSTVNIQQAEGVLTFNNDACQYSTVNITQTGYYLDEVVDGVGVPRLPVITFGIAVGRYSNITIDQFQDLNTKQLQCGVYGSFKNCLAQITQMNRLDVRAFLTSSQLKMIDSSMTYYIKEPGQKNSTAISFANLDLLNSDFQIFNPPEAKTNYNNMSIIARNSTFNLDCTKYKGNKTTLNFIDYTNNGLLQLLEYQITSSIANVLFTGGSSNTTFSLFNVQQLQYTAVYGADICYYQKDQILLDLPSSYPYEVCKKIFVDTYQVLYIQASALTSYYRNDIITMKNGTFVQRQNVTNNITSNTDFRYWKPVVLQQTGGYIITVADTGSTNGFATGKELPADPDFTLQTTDLFTNIKNCNFNIKNKCYIGNNMQDVNITGQVNMMPTCNNITVTADAGDVQIGSGCGVGGQINIKQINGQLWMASHVARNGVLNIVNDGTTGQIQLSDKVFTGSQVNINNKNSKITIGNASCQYCICDMFQTSELKNTDNKFNIDIAQDINRYKSIKINSIRTTDIYKTFKIAGNNTGPKGFIDVFDNSLVNEVISIQNVSCFTSHNSSFEQNQTSYCLKAVELLNSDLRITQIQNQSNDQLTIKATNCRIFEINLTNYINNLTTLNIYNIQYDPDQGKKRFKIMINPGSNMNIANVLIAEQPPAADGLDIDLFGTKTLQYTSIYPALPTSGATKPVFYYYIATGDTAPSLQTDAPAAGNYETLSKIGGTTYQVTNVTINNVTRALWDDIIETDVFCRSTSKQNVKSTLDYRWCKVLNNVSFSNYAGTANNYASVTVFPNIIAGRDTMLQLDSTTKALHTKNEIANWSNVNIDSTKGISADAVADNTTKGHFIVNQNTQNLTVNGPINTAVFSSCYLNMTVNSSASGNVFYDVTSADVASSLKSNMTLNLNSLKEQSIILQGVLYASNVTITYNKNAYIPAFFILSKMSFSSSNINLTNISLHAINSTGEMFKQTTMNITSDYTSVIQVDGTNSFLKSVINGQFNTYQTATDNGLIINLGQNYIQTNGNSFNNSIINFKIQGGIRQNEYTQCFNYSQLDIDIYQTNYTSPALNIGTNNTFNKCSGKYYTYDVFNEISLCNGKVDIYMTNDNQPTNREYNKLCSETSIKIISKINQVNNQIITFNKTYPPYALEVEHSIFLEHPTNLIKQKLPKMRIINSKILSFSFNNAAPSHIVDATIPFVKESRQITFQNCLIERWFEIGQATDQSGIGHSFMFNVLYVAVTDFTLEPTDGSSTSVSTRLHVIKPKVATSTIPGYQNINSSEYSLIVNGLLWDRIAI